jgi:hypothetical protein
MKTETLLRGTKEELVEHFYGITKNADKVIKKNLLSSKEGITQQLDDIIKKQNGVGMVFYLTENHTINPTSGEFSELNLVLQHAAVYVERTPAKKIVPASTPVSASAISSTPA